MSSGDSRRPLAVSDSRCFVNDGRCVIDELGALEINPAIAFAMVALVASILIVYFDTAHKLKLLDERIENIEISGPQTK